MHGIMEGSVLTVKIIEARELQSSRMSGSLNPYVVVSIESQRSQTDPVPSSCDPVWNEVIAYDIVTEKEPLTVEVFDSADIGRDALVGRCEINLKNLRDQLAHDEQFQLFNEKQKYAGKIRLSL